MAGADKQKANPVVDACLDMSYNQPEGCLFVIELSKAHRPYYKPSNMQIFARNGVRLSVLRERDRVIIRKIASLDGAMIINSNGELVHLGATLLHSRNLVGHGKRHSFALGTTAFDHDLVCVLSSEEDRHIRTFRSGLLVAEIDGETRIPVSTRNRLAELLTSRITSLIIASSIAASLLTVNPIPAIVTISGTQIITFEGFERVRQFFTRGGKTR